ncbi:DUF302 domain-containing protein [Thermotoga sp. SG1]|uniref:DUF302 domain-containing protein n=1 Tax=Thermotoga sp. SG1 TaxID=126739 RepID=UPI000C75928F|nr:DUF302 domain-containing protein [Thermotoga sp. SG1]PLV56320.1 hypothetical protein AS006_07110 [Thermotoga sp. SG1]
MYKQEKQEKYLYSKELDLPFDRAVEIVKERLKSKGFGVISEIRVDRLFREKLGLEIPSQVIIGACNPRFSSRLIAIDPDSAVFLPCNITVYVKDQKTHIDLLSPTKAMSITENRELLDVAKEVENALKEALESV